MLLVFNSFPKGAINVADKLTGYNAPCLFMQDKDKWSKEKFDTAAKAKAEADRLAGLEGDAADKAK